MKRRADQKRSENEKIMMLLRTRWRESCNDRINSRNSKTNCFEERTMHQPRDNHHHHPHQQLHLFLLVPVSI